MTWRESEKISYSIDQNYIIDDIRMNWKSTYFYDFAFFDLFGESEIDYLDSWGVLLTAHNVLRLEIQMNDPHAVEVLDTGANLAEELHCFGLRQVEILRYDALKELTSWEIEITKIKVLLFSEKSKRTISEDVHTKDQFLTTRPNICPF